jgi:hypothetical protein
MTREEQITHRRIQQIPEKLDSLTVQLKRIADALEAAKK